MIKSDEIAMMDKVEARIDRVLPPDNGESEKTPYYLALKTRLDKLPQKERKKLLFAERNRLLHEKKGVEKSIFETGKELIRLDEMKDAFNKIEEWRKGVPVFQKVDGSQMHALRACVIKGEIHDLFAWKTKINPRDWSEFLSESTVFVLTHDWASAFKDATDFEAGPFRLPFDICAFEFALSGNRIIAFALEVDNGNLEPDICMQIAVRIDGSWVFDCQRFTHGPNGWGAPDFYELIGNQIKAICVALDAAVAVTEAVRTPYKLNIAREKNGKPPLSDYHIVNLSRQTRARPLEAHGQSSARRRLHFRRGHWRHFEIHKTWVRWCLVGDPDLGFIDKEYRL
jgi:hypothetical protein